MIAGKKYHGSNVDIWSCGVILFALVCGYLPFEDPNTAALYKKILTGEFKLPYFVSEECKDLIKKILTTKPDKRYTATDIREHSWFKIYTPKDASILNEQEEGIIIGHQAIPVII